MATGTRLMQEISDQFLNCKICFENFRDPKTLTCLHTFCCTCLQNQYEQEVSSRSSRYTISIYSRQVTCPLCRKKTDLPTGGVKRLPDNFLVSNLTEVLAKRTVSKVPPCDICSTVRAKNVDACSKCLDCSKILCKACVGLHLSTKVTQQHSLIDLEGEKDIQCKVHADECVRFYCEPCDACICVVCAFQEHKDHDVCSFSDGFSKNKSSLESLLDKCKERLGNVSTRINAIEKYETVVKDVKERIRDLAINYISQVRAKEKELMNRIEDEYGGKIQEFVDQKQSLQENLDELHSTCNLTDIMLKDKAVELLLIKKDIEGKMNQLLQPSLPELPSQPKYDVTFVPGDVTLGRLSFDNSDNWKDGNDDIGETIPLKRMKMEELNANVGCLTQTIEPDVVTDTSQFEKGRTKEMFTSMSSDMRAGFSNINCQTDSKSVVSRDTCTNIVETRERGVFAKVSDMKARGTMTERSDVRSLKCQTDQSHTSGTCEDLINSQSISSQDRFFNSSTSLEQSEVSKTNKAQTVSMELITQTERRSDTTNMSPVSPRGDCRPAPDLLPTSAGLSAFAYTPGRRIRSIKIQTEISSLDVEETAASTDMEFINNIIKSQIMAEKMKEENENKITQSRFRNRPRRVRATDNSYEVKVGPDMKNDWTSPERAQSSRDTGVAVKTEVTRIDKKTGFIRGGDSTSCTHLQNHLVKATSTQAVNMNDKDTSTPIITSESKVTWTEILPTSDRATCTVETKMQDRSIGTIPVKTGDLGVQIKPYCSAVSTNTPLVASSDQDSQTTVETTEQGTMSDIQIETHYPNKEKEVMKTTEVVESSVDFIPPSPLPIKTAVQLVDRATDPIKTICFSKSTETATVKTVSSSTETLNIKSLDKETATLDAKTVDQWTETHTPQLISTGVTPPIPATIDVGVATNVVLTDEQATCTDVKAYRNTHTETIIVVCDNETLTEKTRYTDAQTSMDVCTDNQECETDKLENTDECSMTEHTDKWEPVGSNTHSTQCEPPVLRTRETNTTRKRRKPKETQTIPTPIQCTSCGHINSEHVQNGLPDTNTSSGLQIKMSGDHAHTSGKEFKDSSTMPDPPYTQEVGTMAISCVTCLHDFQETAIQTSQPQLYDKSSATSFELDLDFLERALSRDYQDAATSTESLPYIGLLSEIDVDELIVVPQAAFELVSDTDSEYDLIMVDDETSTDFLQTVEAGTQTLVAIDDPANAPATNISSMTESTNSKGIGEVIKSMVQSQGFNSDMSNNSFSKNFASIGINTMPKATFEKETCTPIRHLFTKGTMTFFVAKMDKSTSTLNQARIITGSSATKIKSEDKVTMTTRAEKKSVGVETETTDMDGKITKCISKLRSVSEKLNSPPAKKTIDNNTFFGTNFTATKSTTDPSDKTNSNVSTSAPSSSDTSEDERQRQLKALLEQTNALLKSKDRSPIRKPQPITTLKGRKPGCIEGNNISGNVKVSLACPISSTLKPEETVYGSKSLPRGFSSDRPGTVRMGSQPLSPSRLPLLRYNSAPGRIATVPTQTLLKISGQGTPILGPCSSPRLSPSKIPISKKLSPPDYQIRQPQQQESVEAKPQEPSAAISPLRRPLPSITETRTPSSCSDSSTASYVSAESNASNTDSTVPSTVSEKIPTMSATTIKTPNIISVNTPTTSSSTTNRLSIEFPTTPPRSPSITTSLSTTSVSLSDSVFRKSTSDLSHSADSSDTLEDKSPPEEKSIPTPPKKSGMGFMQRLLSRKKKETKKEPVSVIKAGPTTANAVAALASAAPPLPAAPPESYAIAPLHLPPHHYPPLPEHTTPTQPRKPRPFVYVQQRIVSIQQDNVEEMEDKKTKADDKTPEENKDDQSSGKDKKKDKTCEKQKDKSKKEAQVEKERKKKEEKEKEKAKAKVIKAKVKKSDEKGQSSLSSSKADEGLENRDKK